MPAGAGRARGARGRRARRRAVEGHRAHGLAARVLQREELRVGHRARARSSVSPRLVALGASGSTPVDLALADRRVEVVGEGRGLELLAQRRRAQALVLLPRPLHRQRRDARRVRRGGTGAEEVRLRRPASSPLSLTKKVVLPPSVLGDLGLRRVCCDFGRRRPAGVEVDRRACRPGGERLRQERAGTGRTPPRRGAAGGGCGPKVAGASGSTCSAKRGCRRSGRCAAGCAPTLPGAGPGDDDLHLGSAGFEAPAPSGRPVSAFRSAAAAEERARPVEEQQVEVGGDRRRRSGPGRRRR